MEKKQQVLRFAIYAVALLPLLIHKDITPNNELKYLSIADEALRDGHFWTLFNHGAVYADKPPLYIWLIMGMKLLTGGHHPFLLSLFSLIPAFITLGVFTKWCEKELYGRWAVAAEAGLLTGAYFLGSAIVLRMDMLMIMFITLAMYTFWKMHQGDTSVRQRILFPVYVFMAIFSKGPVGIMVPLFCIPAYLISIHRFREMKIVWGWMSWLILIVLCGIWWGCVYLEGGREYLDNLLFHQTVDRAVDAFHHKQPFYYYGYTIWYAMAPWCLLTIPAIIYALIKKVRQSELCRFFLTVAAVIIVMMSAVSSKLAVYILPCFGFIHCAALMLMKEIGIEWGRKVISYGSAALLSIVFVGGFFTGKFNDRLGYRNVCGEAFARATELGITKYAFCDLRSAENMDVFLGTELEEISAEELAGFEKGEGIPEGGIIVFLKDPEGKKKAVFEVFRKISE